MTERFEQKAAIEITSDDLIAAQRLGLWANYRRGWLRIIAVWIASVAFFAVVMGDSLSGRGLTAFALVALVLIPGIPVLLVYLLGSMSARRTYKAQKSLHGPVELSWDDDVVRFVNHAGEGRLKWSDLYRSAQNEAIILLYESDRLMRMIPKRFLSDAQIADITDRIRKAHPKG